MTTALKIVQRSLVVEFYKQNAAFFGLLLLVFFGFIKSSEHIAIGSFLVNNPEALFFVYVLWLAYAIKIVLFLLPTFYRPENQILANYYLLNKRSKIAATFSAALFLLMPAISYGTFLIGLSVLQGAALPIIAILASMAILVMLLALFINYQLNRLPREKKILQLRLFKKIIIPPELFYVSYLLRKEMVLLLLSKVYGCLLIIGTVALYSTDDFDLRLLSTGVMLAAVGNVAILHKYVWFQYHPMAFSQNLPVSFFKISVGHTLNFFMLLIPEFIVLMRYYPLDPGIFDVAGLLLFAIGLCYLMYAWMLRKQTNLSDFLIVVFWLIVVSTFFILFSVHPIFLGFFILVISITITYIRRYQYEHLE